MVNDSNDLTAAEAEKLRINRRTAMKAALGGAVMAAAWSAPKIEGLSLSPDYASALSNKTFSGNLFAAHASQSSGLARCAGATAGFSNCGSAYATEVVFAVPGHPTETFKLNADISGQVKNSSTTAVQLSGITDPDYSCAVSISGNCSSGNLSGQGTYTLKTTAPNLSVGTKCNGGSLTPNSAITVNFTCTY